MNIGIDASRANKSTKTGTEWYSYQLIEQFKQIDKSNTFFLYTREPLTGELSVCPGNFYEKILSWPFRYIWTHVRLSWEMIVKPVDILFVPAHSLPLISRSRGVVTIHDLGFLHNTNLYHPLARWYHRFSAWWSIRRAKHIVTISEFTKSDIIRLYGVDPKSITVTPLGIDRNRYCRVADVDMLASIRSKYHLPEKFFLFVGRLEKKKNIPLLIKAWNRFVAVHPDYYLVLAGRTSYGFQEISSLLKQAHNVITTGYVPEDDLPSFFNLAQAFVFPSLFEGFGLVVLEAMASGCPVICSNAGSLPEIVGNAGIYFDPTCEDELVDRLSEFISSSELADSLRERGSKRCQQFSWEETAKKTWLVLTKSH